MKTDNSRARNNREKIIKAALRLFRERGVKKVSVQEIAAAADLAPATIYNHFGTKEALVRETLAYFLNSMMERYQDIMEAKVPFDVKAEQLLRAGAELYHRDRGEFLRLMMSEDPELQRIAEEFQDSAKTTRWVHDFFEEGKRSGAVHPDLSIESAIRYADVIREGVTALARNNDDPDFLPKLIDDITPLYLYGIMLRPDAENPRQKNDNEVSA